MSGEEESPRPKTGRPTKFRQAMCVQVRKLAKIGATEKEIADFLDISEATLLNWKSHHPSFLRSLKSGKRAVDNRVEQSLFRRATGYSHESEEIFMVEERTITKDGSGKVIATEVTKKPVRVPTVKLFPPDTVACIFWLKNRRKDKWRDVKAHQLTGKDDAPIEHKHTYGSTELLRDFYRDSEVEVSGAAVSGGGATVGSDE